MPQRVPHEWCQKKVCAPQKERQPPPFALFFSFSPLFPFSCHQRGMLFYSGWY